MLKKKLELYLQNMDTIKEEQKGKLYGLIKKELHKGLNQSLFTLLQAGVQHNQKYMRFLELLDFLIKRNNSFSSLTKEHLQTFFSIIREIVRKIKLERELKEKNIYQLRLTLKTWEGINHSPVYGLKVIDYVKDRLFKEYKIIFDQFSIQDQQLINEYTKTLRSQKNYLLPSSNITKANPQQSSFKQLERDIYQQCPELRKLKKPSLQRVNPSLEKQKAVYDIYSAVFMNIQ